MREQQSKTVLVMAGGTGGHVFPALATAEHLLKQGHKVHWLGTEKGLESKVVPEANIPFYNVSIKGVRGKGFLSRLMAPFRVLYSITQVLQLLREIKPDVVLGMGGFVAGPGSVAARILSIPLVIHEQNARAGMTNKLASRFATRVLTAFEGASVDLPISQQVGNPVRGNILQLPDPEARYLRRTGPLRVLVVGGSLGAKAINEVMPAWLASLSLAHRPSVWHQTGKLTFTETLERYQKAGLDAHVEPFIDRMDEAYGWADLVICRAGALTVSELAIAGVASILVPYPHAVDDHQTANAEVLTSVKAARLLSQTEFTEANLNSLYQEIADRPLLLEMALAARSVAKPTAASDVAKICLEMISE